MHDSLLLGRSFLVQVHCTPKPYAVEVLVWDTVTKTFWHLHWGRDSTSGTQIETKGASFGVTCDHGAAVRQTREPKTRMY